MANFHFKALNIADESDLDIYINGTSSTQEINEVLTKISNLSYDFSDVEHKLQGQITLKFSNKFGDFDSFYSDFSTGLWIIEIDSVEYFRGIPDLNAFTFDRKRKTASIKLLSGNLDERSVDFSSLTTHSDGTNDFYSISEWLDKIVLDELGLTVSYDIQSRGTFDSDDSLFIKSDAGANDFYFLLQKLESAETNRIKEMFDLFGLKFAIWKNKLYVWERNRYFSDNVTIDLTDKLVQKVLENKSYEIKDFSFNSIIKTELYDEVKSYISIADDSLINLPISDEKYEVGINNWLIIRNGDNGGTRESRLLSINSQLETNYFELHDSDVASISAGDTVRFSIRYEAELNGWDTTFFCAVGSNVAVAQLTQTGEKFTIGDGIFQTIDIDVPILDASTKDIQFGFFGVNQTDLIFQTGSIFNSVGNTNLMTIFFLTEEHGLTVGDLFRIGDTGSNFLDGNYNVSAIDVGGNLMKIEAIPLNIISTFASSSGVVYKNVNNIRIKVFTQSVYKISKKTKTFSNLNIKANPTRLALFDKGTTNVVDLYSNNYLSYSEDVAEIYNDVIGRSSVRRIKITVKNEAINPYSRIIIDSINYLIIKFSFDFVTKNKILELIEE